ncbi:MAG: c-type cytochrome [Pseudomonadota bacterium]
MRSFPCFSLLLFCALIFSGFSEAGPFRRRGSEFKGFNPCGWNSCRVSGGVRPGIFQRWRQRRMARRGRCGSGMCGPRQGGGGGCSNGSCGGGGLQAGSHGGQTSHGGQQGFQGGSDQGGGSFVGGETSPGGRRVADDEVPAPILEGAEATQNEPNQDAQEDVAKGEAVFNASCVGCHTNEKTGIIKEAKDWKKDEFERAVDAVKDGRMPQRKKLSPEEKKNLIAYLEAQIQKEEEEKEVSKPQIGGAEPETKPAVETAEKKEVSSRDPLTADLSTWSPAELFEAQQQAEAFSLSEAEMNKNKERSAKISAEFKRRDKLAGESPRPIPADQSPTMGSTLTAEESFKLPMGDKKLVLKKPAPAPQAGKASKDPIGVKAAVSKAVKTDFINSTKQRARELSEMWSPQALEGLQLREYRSPTMEPVLGNSKPIRLPDPIPDNSGGAKSESEQRTNKALGQAIESGTRAANQALVGLMDWASNGASTIMSGIARAQQKDLFEQTQAAVNQGSRAFAGLANLGSKIPSGIASSMAQAEEELAQKTKPLVELELGKANPGDLFAAAGSSQNGNPFAREDIQGKIIYEVVDNAPLKGENGTTVTILKNHNVNNLYYFAVPIPGRAQPLILPVIKEGEEWVRDPYFIK